MSGQSIDRRKQRAATLSLAYNALLTLIKAVAAVLTGSVSLFTEAAHSATDVIASSFAYMSIRAASQPPDEDHNYGHGKIETLAGFGEAVLLMIIVGIAIYEAIQRVFSNHVTQHIGWGMVVMAVSAISNLIVAMIVSKTAKETESIALKSNSQHLMVDLWTSLGVLAALAVSHWTGWHQADPVFAIALSIWILVGAWNMCRVAFEQLIDHRLSDEDVEKIKTILSEISDLKGYHKLRTRLSGNVKYVDVHIEVSKDWSVVRAHTVADLVEKAIEDALRPAVATIHVDPVE